MARETRQQRRARRAQASAGGDGGLVERAPSRHTQVRPAAEPAKSQTGAPRSGERGGSRRFVAESWAELRKVEWPGQSQVIQATTVVLIACAIVGAFLFVIDLGFERLVEKIVIP